MCFPEIGDNLGFMSGAKGFTMTNLNLISDPWFSVRRSSGRRELVAPWGLTGDVGSDPILALDYPRPDLASSVTQFLVGLLQAAMTPDAPRAWDRLYREPPSCEELAERLMPLEAYFGFAGAGPRCFQDQGVSEDELRPIAALLMEEPGEQTRKQNKDLFIKRGRFDGLGLSVAIAALINLQTAAPSGGQGHRTSMRGGGPLTTMLVPDPNGELPPNLWRKLWLNVFIAERFGGLTGNHALKEPAARFPWLAPCRSSETKSGVSTSPNDAHPLQMYFSTPRRIWLDFESAEQGVCPLSGREELLIRSYRTRNFGVNYEGVWEHPFSPHRLDAAGLPIPLHPQPGGIGYRHWLHLTLGAGDGQSKDSVRPAKIVACAQDRYRRDHRALVWTHGYDMDNMKARGWYESTMPIYQVKDETRELLAWRAEGLIESAKTIASNLRQAVRKAWKSERASVSGDLSFITHSFWQRTESSFYRALDQEYRHLTMDDPAPDRSGWHRSLCAQAIALFDLHATSGDIAFENPRRIARARRELIKDNHSKAILARLEISRRAA